MTSQRFNPPPPDTTHFQVSPASGELSYWAQKSWYYSDSECRWITAWHSWDEHHSRWVFECSKRFLNPLIPIEEMWNVIVQALPRFTSYPGTRPAGGTSFPVAIHVRPLLVPALLGQTEDGRVVMAVDSESSAPDQARGIWHETMHLLRMAAGVDYHDEATIEEEAEQLARCVPDILVRLGLEPPAEGTEARNAGEPAESDLVRKAIAAVPQMD